MSDLMERYEREKIEKNLPKEKLILKEISVCIIQFLLAYRVIIVVIVFALLLFNIYEEIFREAIFSFGNR